MATERRRCKKCNRFGHYAKTCKTNARKTEVRPRMVDAAQSMGATQFTHFDKTQLETTQPDGPGEHLPDPGGDRAAVGAAEIESALQAAESDNGDWGATEEPDEGPFAGDTSEPASSEPGPSNSTGQPSKMDGPSPASVGFKKSIETVLTIWEVSILKEAAPPPEIRDLVAQAWTDCAQALGWLEKANDPRIALILACGLTGGTYGIATYHVIEAKNAEKERLRKLTGVRE